MSGGELAVKSFQAKKAVDKMAGSLVESTAPGNSGSEQEKRFEAEKKRLTGRKEVWYKDGLLATSGS